MCVVRERGWGCDERTAGKLTQTSVARNVSVCVYIKRDGWDNTPAGTATPAIMDPDGPTIRGIGLTTPCDIRNDSLITAVYDICQFHNILI